MAEVQKKVQAPTTAEEQERLRDAERVAAIAMATAEARATDRFLRFPELEAFITTEESLQVGMAVRVSDLHRNGIVLAIDRTAHMTLVRFDNGEERWWWSGAMEPRSRTAAGTRRPR